MYLVGKWDFLSTWHYYLVGFPKWLKMRGIDAAQRELSIYAKKKIKTIVFTGQKKYLLVGNLYLPGR